MLWKLFAKKELVEASRQAAEAGRKSLDPSVVEQLAEDPWYPVTFRSPFEQSGFIRCQIDAGEKQQIVLDVPCEIYENANVVQLPDEEEEEQNQKIF